MQRLRQGEAQKGAELSTERGAIAVWLVDIVGIDASAALEVKQSHDRAKPHWCDSPIGNFCD
jgi:hypothetical protein